MQTIRNKIAALAISTIGLIGISNWEGWSDKAYRPLPTDRPTIGWGSTNWENGEPVKMGETITKERASILIKHELNAYERGIKACLKEDLFQYEFDAYLSLSYNVGIKGVCRSSIPMKLAMHDYNAACKTILQFNKFQGKVLRGLDNRRKDEYLLCMGFKEAKPSIDPMYKGSK